MNEKTVTVNIYVRGRRPTVLVRQIIVDKFTEFREDLMKKGIGDRGFTGGQSCWYPPHEIARVTWAEDERERSRT